eukprot:gene11191-18806_t
MGVRGTRLSNYLGVNGDGWCVRMKEYGAEPSASYSPQSAPSSSGFIQGSQAEVLAISQRLLQLQLLLGARPSASYSPQSAPSSTGLVQGSEAEVLAVSAEPSASYSSQSAPSSSGFIQGSEAEVLAVSQRLLQLQLLLGGSTKQKDMSARHLHTKSEMEQQAEGEEARGADVVLTAGTDVDVLALISRQPGLLLTDSWRRGSSDEQETLGQLMAAWEFGLGSDDAEEWKRSSRAAVSTEQQQQEKSAHHHKQKQAAAYQQQHEEQQSEAAHSREQRSTTTHHRSNRALSYQRPLKSTWAQKRRSDFKAGILDPGRSEALKAVGFEFSKDEAEWQRWFCELRKFQEVNGHCSVQPLATGADMYLINWKRSASDVVLLISHSPSQFVFYAFLKLDLAGSVNCSGMHLVGMVDVQFWPDVCLRPGIRVDLASRPLRGHGPTASRVVPRCALRVTRSQSPRRDGPGRTLTSPCSPQLPNSSSNGDAKLSPKSSDNKSGDSTYQCHHHGCRDEECDASESRGASSSGVPDWVHSLINSTFYEPCTHGHEGYKKNECAPRLSGLESGLAMLAGGSESMIPQLETCGSRRTFAEPVPTSLTLCTFFCTTCSPKGMGGLCQHCMDCHANEGHQTIQIRRYVYCDVVRAVDISSHLDISGVQVYIVNQANVVFLNHRPQSKPARSSSHDSCQTCARQLREGCSFCSLACKVEAMCKSEGCVQPKPAPKPKIAEAPQQRSPKSATDPQVPSKRRRSNPSTEYQYQSSRAYQAQPERSYANIHANVSSGDEGASGVWNHSLPGSPYNQLDCNHEAMLAVATLSLPGLTHSTLDYSTEAMHAAALLGKHAVALQGK